MEDNKNKQSWVALRHAVAKRAHCTEKEAAAFLESLVHQTVSGLQSEKMVRISSLGTFRLQAVAPRKSVHVGTGEPIIIEGYNKVAFAPEASVKTAMNNPTPKLVPESDPIRKLGEQADEILDILADMGQGPVVAAAVAGVSVEAETKETPAETETTETPAEAETNAEEETETERNITETIEGSQPEEETETERNITETIEESQPEEETENAEVPVVAEPETEPEKPVEIPVTVPAEEKEQPAEEPAEEPKKRKKSHTGLTILITMLVFVLICVCGYFFLQHKIVTWMDDMRHRVDSAEVAVTPVAQTPDTHAIEEPDTTVQTASVEDGISTAEPAAEVENVPAEQPAPKKSKPATPKKKKASSTPAIGNYTSFITTEEMHMDSRLAWMAYRYWGKKDLWVYLYDANRDNISDPDVITVGTPIRVPRLTREQQDLNNPDTQRFIEQILNETH